MSHTSCHGTDVDNAFDIGSPEECLDICAETDGCVWASYFAEDEFCLLTEDCTAVEACGDCYVSTVNNLNCALDGGGGDDNGMPPNQYSSYFPYRVFFREKYFNVDWGLEWHRISINSGDR